MGLKEELVGHCTLAVMALIGMALYSGTYSIIYASIGVSEPTVAILEMWMTSVHLFSALGCCILQGVFAAVFKRRETALPHLGEAQTSLFLGVACAVTILGNNCMQYGECSAYYGAARFPRLAAAGSVAWVWIMYASSLGCQTWMQGGVSLGFNEKQGLTAASTMLMLPFAVNEKLTTTCGWTKMMLCTQICDSITPMLMIFAGILMCHGGGILLQHHYYDMVGRILSVLGPTVVVLTLLFMPTLMTAYNATAAAFGTNTLLSEIWMLRKKRKNNNMLTTMMMSSNNNNNNETTTTTSGSGFKFSLSGIKQKIMGVGGGGSKPHHGSSRNAFHKL